MPDTVQDSLVQLSEAFAERARLARPLVAGIAAPGHRMRSGTFWRKDVVVSSEQAFPDAGDATVTLADGSALAARVAGRDPGTNVIAFRLDGGPDMAPFQAAEPQTGALALAFGVAEGGVSTRLGVIHSVGPSWHSRAGGRIERRITVDIAVGRREEGGPVVDAGGGLLGISTLGPRGIVLVIPSATIASVIEPLLSKGRVERSSCPIRCSPQPVSRAA
jgi:S1-C subfamily serine protease